MPEKLQLIYAKLKYGTNSFYFICVYWQFKKHGIHLILSSSLTHILGPLNKFSMEHRFHRVYTKNPEFKIP